MAANQQAALRLKKPKALLMDVSGTLTQSAFTSSILAPYFEKNHKIFLTNNIDKAQISQLVDQMRTAASVDREAPKIADSDDVPKAALIDWASAYVEHCVKNKKENKPFVMFRFMVLFDGFDRNKITTPVYP